MKAHTCQFSVEMMSKTLQVSRSGYYKWKSNFDYKANKTNRLVDAIKSIHEKSGRTYGSPRVTIELLKQGWEISDTKVARVMSKHQIHVKRKRKYIHTTDSKHSFKTCDNILDRNFEVDSINKAWVSDITYIPLGSTFVYLTMVMDLYDRAIIGWNLSHDMSTRQTTIPVLKKAISNRPVAKPNQLIFHSDRGVQYACHEFKNMLQQLTCVQSMSRKGNCWDNAVAESFFKTIKTEKLNKVKIQSFEHAYSEVFRYIEGWYNTQRIHSHLNGLSPSEFTRKNTFICDF
jgi:transposase InsO family protein